MQNITTLFTDPKDIVDPVKEKEFMRKLQALEDTDSECFDGTVKYHRFYSLLLQQHFILLKQRNRFLAKYR